MPEGAPRGAPCSSQGEPTSSGAGSRWVIWLGLMGGSDGREQRSDLPRVCRPTRPLGRLVAPASGLGVGGGQAGLGDISRTSGVAPGGVVSRKAGDGGRVVSTDVAAVNAVTSRNARVW